MRKCQRKYANVWAIGVQGESIVDGIVVCLKKATQNDSQHTPVVIHFIRSFFELNKTFAAKL